MNTYAYTFRMPKGAGALIRQASVQAGGLHKLIPKMRVQWLIIGVPLGIVGLIMYTRWYYKRHNRLPAIYMAKRLNISGSAGVQPDERPSEAMSVNGVGKLPAPVNTQKRRRVALKNSAEGLAGNGEWL